MTLSHGHLSASMSEAKVSIVIHKCQGPIIQKTAWHIQDCTDSVMPKCLSGSLLTSIGYCNGMQEELEGKRERRHHCQKPHQTSLTPPTPRSSTSSPRPGQVSELPELSSPDDPYFRKIFIKLVIYIYTYMYITNLYILEFNKMTTGHC